MKRFVFFSLPGHGHTNPTLSVAKELVARGNTVIYYSTDEFREIIETAGAIYKKYPGGLHGDARISRNIATFGKALMDATEIMTPLMIKEVAKLNPDCIAYDTLALWGKAIATNLSIPAVAFHTTIAFNKKVFRKNLSIYFSTLAKALQKRQLLFLTYYKYQKLAKKYLFAARKIDEFIFNEEACNIVFTSLYFQPAAESFNKTYHFVGLAMTARREDTTILKELNSKQKLIYISVGTIFNDNVDFFRTCIETFKDTNYQVIISLGKRFTLKDLPPIPRNMIIKDHIPQLAVLEKAAIFVTHAGMNSISESAYYGIPMVLIPQMDEQTINARRIKELGAGIKLNKARLTPEVLLKAVETILSDTSYHTNVTKIQKSLRKTGGAKEAADVMEKYLQK